jgi:hypothetical protein
MARHVPYPKISADGEITIEMLERCLARLAIVMARAPHRGEVYLPIFQRLEDEIEAKKVKEVTLERARALAEKSIERTRPLKATQARHKIGGPAQGLHHGSRSGVARNRRPRRNRF